MVKAIPQSGTVLEESAVQEFRTRLRGQLIGPEDPDYDIARRVHNGMIDRHPRLIACCRDVADVIAAVNFGREHGLALAVRSGSHNAAGLGTCADGLVIDLSPMCGIRVDPTARTARVESGCVWGDVDHATHAFGLATRRVSSPPRASVASPSAVVSDTSRAGTA